MTDARAKAEAETGHRLQPGHEQHWGPRPSDIAKTRDCLRCGRAFASQWSGERICGRCKGSSAWREGTVTSGLTSTRR